MNGPRVSLMPRYRCIKAGRNSSATNMNPIVNASSAMSSSGFPSGVALATASWGDLRFRFGSVFFANGCIALAERDSGSQSNDLSRGTNSVLSPRRGAMSDKTWLNYAAELRWRAACLLYRRSPCWSKLDGQEDHRRWLWKRCFRWPDCCFRPVIDSRDAFVAAPARAGSPAVDTAQRREWNYGHVRIAWGGARD